MYIAEFIHIYMCICIYIHIHISKRLHVPKALEVCAMTHASMCVNNPVVARSELRAERSVSAGR